MNPFQPSVGTVFDPASNEIPPEAREQIKQHMIWVAEQQTARVVIVDTRGPVSAEEERRAKKKARAEQARVWRAMHKKK